MNAPEHHHFADGVFRGKGSANPCARCILEHAAPDLLEACEEALKLVTLARQYFPKSIKTHHKFALENTCATIGNAIYKAKTEGRES